MVYREDLGVTDRHRQIINAIIEKAEALCPDSLALIGVYGSCATGDTHEKSDLDLLILINDEGGRCLADGFILDDQGVGYDLYCTAWDMLERDAECAHPHLGKLMDAQIVFVKDPAAPERLESLRKRAAGVLSSDARFEKAFAALERAKGELANAYLEESLSRVRLHAAATIHCLLEAVMLYHGRYFRRGVKRTFEEISALSLPFGMEGMVLDVIRGESAADIRVSLTSLARRVREHMATPHPRVMPSAENLTGTYEEMLSNWRNKMDEAAERGDLFSSFMNIASLQFMLDDISAEVDMPRRDAMEGFDPRELQRNAEAFDGVLTEYLDEYRRVGIEPRRFADTQAFLKDYLPR